MSRQNLDFGRRAENAAVKFLEAQGYRILRRNYKTRLGEIDIIAEEKDVLCFIEVKARHSEEFGTPLEAIGLTKQKQVAKSAFCYLKENRALDHAARFDVVALLYKEDKPAIDLIRDAFTLSPEFTA